MTPTTTVLIVGAGPTGLTLACELARRGVAFRLIEAAPGPQPGSRGKGLQPRTLEVFENVGVTDRLLGHGRIGMAMRTIAPDGTVTMGGAVTLHGRPDIPYPASLITPQWRVEEALRQRLAELGGAVELGTALEQLTQDDDAVSAVVVRGEVRDTVTARWLVGCDGGHSAVRKQVGIAFEGDTHDDIRMVVADVAVDGLDRDAWHIWQHPEGMVTLCPMPSTELFQYQAGLAPGEVPELALASLQAVLDRRTGRTDLRLHGLAWASVWRANIRLAARYRAGGVFLAGDAAHIHSPAGGQGMNTGIQDAYNLGWKLAAVAAGAPAALLDSYEAERRPIAAGVLAMSNALLKQVIDHQAMPKRDPRTMQLAVGYRGSALARDDRDGAATVRAGDRAPDATQLATVDGERRLFELIRGTSFTLLNFGPPGSISHDPHTLQVVAHATRRGEVVDTGGHLARAYGATERTLVVIRPDGYIGMISDAGDAAEVVGYLLSIEP